MNETLKEIIDYYKNHMDAGSSEDLLSMLREIQEVEGYIPVEVQTAISAYFSIKPSYLTAVMKRYPSLKEQPSKYDVKVCTGSRCQTNASAETIKEFERQLRISKGQASPDSMFSLNSCPCMHLCQKGPNVMINGEIFHHVDKNQVSGLIKKFRAQ